MSHLKKAYDIILLTDKRYHKPAIINDYIQNVLTEDGLIQKALEKKGYKVERTYWDNPNFDWQTTQAVLFRTTWDYFDRFEAFFKWLAHIDSKTQMINSYDLIRWNIDKHYLGALRLKGISIVPTLFIEQGETRSLKQITATVEWESMILKPAIAGAARHTYKIKKDNIQERAGIFRELIANEAMLLQPFLETILEKGEVSFMLFGGKFSHAILKKAKAGDFRVQDDFGGSVHAYEASQEEIVFCEAVIRACDTIPVYSRVDAMWNDQHELCVSEVELIEPELWMRFHPLAADYFAEALAKITNLVPISEF